MVRAWPTANSPRDGSAADSLAGTTGIPHPRHWCRLSRRPVSGPSAGGLEVRERDCCLRDFNFLGLVVLITAVETVDNPVSRRGSAVKPCSWTVGSAGFKQPVDGDKIFGPFR